MLRLAMNVPDGARWNRRGMTRPKAGPRFFPERPGAQGDQVKIASLPDYQIAPGDFALIPWQTL
jgi:hypothetical protein